VRGPTAVNAPGQVHAIGTTPPAFDGVIENCREVDILNLIVFYNDNFGILQGDSIAVRQRKFRRVLTEF
jgi:hypothetical protein